MSDSDHIQEQPEQPSMSRLDIQAMQDVYTDAVSKNKKIFLAVEIDTVGKLFKVEWNHGIPELQNDTVYTKYFIDSVAKPPIYCPPGTAFNPATRQCEPIIATEMRVVGIEGTETDTKNTLTSLQDKKAGTRWSAKGHGSFITLDMGRTRDVGAIRILWFRAFERSYTFDVDVGTDGVNWKSVYKDRKSTIAPAPETYNLNNENCRFIKLTIYGNSKNEWASITDIVVLSKYEVA